MSMYGKFLDKKIDYRSKGGIDRRSFLMGAAAVGASAVGAGLTGCAPSGDRSNTNSTSGNGGSIKYSFETPPDPIEESQISETITADIIVIGSGCSGMVTAVSALESGGEVILFSAGTKAVSRGGSNHGINTKTQKQYGIDYTPESSAGRMKSQLAEGSYRPDQQKWARWIENSSEAMDWLINMMAAEGYEATLEVGYEDPQGVWTCPPSSHNFIAKPGEAGGFVGQGYVMQVLEKKIGEHGGQIHWSTRALYLERENGNTGRVTSVIAQKEDGSYVRYSGRKAIVMATGDFSQNHEMMEKYAPWCMPLLTDAPLDYDAGFQFGGLMPGDGQKMGLWIGAAWQRILPNAPAIDSIGPAPYTQSVGNHTGINLNRNGERFMNEDTICSYSALSFMLQPAGEAYFVWDSEYAKRYDVWTTFGSSIPQDNGMHGLTPEQELASWEKSVKDGSYVKGNTIEDVLDQFDDIDVKNALKTIDRYNGYVDEGVDHEFHKLKGYLAPIRTAPFYGCKFTTSPALFLCIMGGLRTSPHMEVLDADENPIEGLYNVGVMVGDMYANCYNFSIPGHNLGATCITFPYLLGKELA